jgi:SM-20-related protein
MTTTPDVGARFNPFLVRGFFDTQTYEEIIAQMRSAECGPATIHGRGTSSSVDERVRKAARVMPSRETVELVRRRLLERKGQVEGHFQISLSDCEDPQFLRYQVGDFFVAHQDGNTPLLQFDRDRVRIVSAVIFLSQQSAALAPGTYCGGSLVFSGPLIDPSYRETRLVAGETGTLIAFRSETMHEVTTVNAWRAPFDCLLVPVSQRRLERERKFQRGAWRQSSPAHGKFVDARSNSGQFGVC